MKRSETCTDEIAMPEESREERAADYTAKLLVLEKELGQLTLLEHPVRIVKICREIKSIRNKLQLIHAESTSV